MIQNTFFCDKSETIISCNLINALVIVRCTKIDHILSFIYVGVVRDEREAEVRHRRDGRRGGSKAETEAEQKAETTQRRKPPEFRTMNVEMREPALAGEARNKREVRVVMIATRNTKETEKERDALLTPLTLHK